MGKPPNQPVDLRVLGRLQLRRGKDQEVLAPLVGTRTLAGHRLLRGLCSAERAPWMGARLNYLSAPTTERSIAQAVLDDVIGKGFPASRITAVGRGVTKPVVSESDETYRAINRRVEIALSQPSRR